MPWWNRSSTPQYCMYSVYKGRVGRGREERLRKEEEEKGEDGGGGRRGRRRGVHTDHFIPRLCFALFTYTKNVLNCLSNHLMIPQQQWNCIDKLWTKYGAFLLWWRLRVRLHTPDDQTVDVLCQWPPWFDDVREVRKPALRTKQNDWIHTWSKQGTGFHFHLHIWIWIWIWYTCTCLWVCGYYVCVCGLCACTYMCVQQSCGYQQHSPSPSHKKFKLVI